MVELINAKPAITQEQIKAVEDALNVSLPDDYQQLMLKSNGGIVDPGSFKCKDGTYGSMDWLYYIWTGDKNDILYRAEIRAGRLPRGFVAVGYDGGGNEICIDCNSGPGYGNVYFWDHEMEADPSVGMTPEDAENVHLVADSFTEFLSSLYEPPLPEGSS